MCEKNPNLFWKKREKMVKNQNPIFYCGKKTRKDGKKSKPKLKNSDKTGAKKKRGNFTLISL